MLLNLTDLSSEPLQQQIVRQVRAKILSSDLITDTGLPSIRALARDQRISVITVKRAYEYLENEGLIHSRRGKGFFVSELLDKRKKTMANQKLEGSLKPIINSAIAEGLTEAEIKNTVNVIIKHSGNNAKNTGV